MNETKTLCDYCHKPITWEPIVDRGNKFCDQSCKHFHEAGIRPEGTTPIFAPTVESQREFALGNE